ncbi:MAG: hypothetical protein ACI9IA_000106 [Enterobacterales bacterium]|jgi:hypothetical protein
MTIALSPSALLTYGVMKMLLKNYNIITLYKFFKCISLLMLLTLSTSIMANSSQTELSIAGWIENALLVSHGLKLRAKLDTGAKTSSINAVNIKNFEKQGKLWIKFDITNFEGKTITIERPVLREIVIKRHFADKQVRPVIELAICIGTRTKLIQVNLIDRSGFNYQLLVGRNYLSGNLLVDASSKYKMELLCP